MITYLLKVTLCSGVLLLFYRLVLEREKTFRFNRYYLLGSLLLSVGLPLVPIEIFTEQAYFAPPSAAVELAERGIQARYTVGLISEPALPKDFEWGLLLAGAYILICGSFIFRFGRNIINLLMQTRAKEVRKTEGITLVLLESPTLPHSFLNFIFLDKTEYLSGSVKREILAHECAHVQQWHSLDILLVEFMKAIFWFNPAFYFYRQAIALNHEFLADEAVLTSGQDRATYQYLLLQKAIAPYAHPFTSSFNFSFTKKRFVMMNKHTSRTRALLARVAVLPLIAMAFFAFSDLTLAQIAPPPPPVPVVENKASSDLVKEYNILVDKYIEKKNDFKIIKTPTQTDGLRLEKLLSEMTKDQIETLEYKIHKLGPSPKNRPTESDFEKFKNPTVYGIWINDKKTPNTELSKYKASDFSLSTIHRLYPNAQKTIGYKYKFQVELMTNSYYEKYRKGRFENPYWHLVRNRDKSNP